MKKGHLVVINGSIQASVVLVTKSASLLLSFDGHLDGHIGMLLVMKGDRGGYISLVNDRRFTVEPATMTKEAA